jgi:hypothetical protein
VPFALALLRPIDDERKDAERDDETDRDYDVVEGHGYLLPDMMIDDGPNRGQSD